MEVYEMCEVAFERGSVGYLFLYNALISSSYLENETQYQQWRPTLEPPVWVR